MRHKKGYRKLNKATDQRIAMLRGICNGLFRDGKVITSKTRALEARRFAEKIITLAKKGDLTSRRTVLSKMHNPFAVKEIFSQAPDRFKEKAGGYTRITKIRRRRGDAVQLVLLELI